MEVCTSEFLHHIEIIIKIMRVISSDLISVKNTKRALPTVSELERLEDATLVGVIGQRKVRTLSMANNNIYLSCGIRHFSRSLATSK